MARSGNFDGGKGGKGGGRSRGPAIPTRPGGNWPSKIGNDSGRGAAMLPQKGK